MEVTKIKRLNQPKWSNWNELSNLEMEWLQLRVSWKGTQSIILVSHKRNLKIILNGFNWNENKKNETLKYHIFLFSKSNGIMNKIEGPKMGCVWT